MAWGAAIGAAIGALGSIAGDSIGASQAAGYNKSRQQDLFHWQEKMSSTAYQRAAKDLDKAGLNRILALGSPATTPGGASASIQAPKYGTNAIQAASAAQAIKQSQAQAELLREQSRLIGAEADKAEVTKILYEKLGPKADAIADDLMSKFSSNAKDVNKSPIDFIKDLASDPQTRSNAYSSTKDAAKDIPKKVMERYKKVGDDWVERAKDAGKYIRKKAVEYRKY